MSGYGIDTSVLVRLLTGRPKADFEQVSIRLAQIRQSLPVPLAVSSLVIAEAYAVLQHHYSFSKKEAREALRMVLASGLVAPVDGVEIHMAIAATGEPGLADRLIALDYERHGLRILTLDRQMQRLRGCEIL
jgi:predicted nucleic acid-binding protein